ncbi:hypothetical protein FPOA_05947 [Fusarium poae]|uniref:Uncharacterized protein n=1 Tax=Fusarium poae TaxID=36050 RepID=A0A1B8AYA3_FUSPO|nr:hypothetical protein FPOA_05947 [Fusarium poae]
MLYNDIKTVFEGFHGKGEPVVDEIWAPYIAIGDAAVAGPAAPSPSHHPLCLIGRGVTAFGAERFFFPLPIRAFRHLLSSLLVSQSASRLISMVPGQGTKKINRWKHTRRNWPFILLGIDLVIITTPITTIPFLSSPSSQKKVSSLLSEF